MRSEAKIFVHSVPDPTPGVRLIPPSRAVISFRLAIGVDGRMVRTLPVAPLL